MDGPIATIVAASIAAGVALLIAFVGVSFRTFDRLGRLEKGSEVLEKRVDDLAKSIESLREIVGELSKTVENLSRDFERMQETVRAEHEATRAEIRRLADAMVSHTHDADGNTVFRVPPP